jgi:hypothetical protein
MGGLREAIEEPLDSVPGQDELEVFPTLVGAVQQPLADRRGDIMDLGGTQARASR